MAAGLRVKNAAGVYQIDETYVNFVFISKASSTTNTLAINDLYYRDISVSGRTAPILAVKSASAHAIYGGQVSGDTWTWRVLMQGNGTAFDYYVFDLAPVDTTAGPGLRVYNAAGDPVYSSNQNPLRIAPGTLVSNGLWPSADLTTFGAGRTWAALQIGWGFGESEINDISGERENWYGGAFTTSDGLGYDHLTYAKIGSGYGFIASETTAVFLAVDVTHY